ncbi:aminopeptidase Ey-like isoform X2 [Watersipora subatra]|uniref:aminopeptidase Ey-like isoform X2 n=1 Tax=Watersipora subatra TaxID=2589382 RepID=UPI00355C07E9
MGSREAFEMRDSSHELVGGDSKEQKGCHVTVAMGFCLLLLGLVICVGVGVVIFFAKTTPECPSTTAGLSNNGIWWNDPDCLTACIQQGVCEKDATKPETTAKPPAAATTTPMMPTTATPMMTTTTASAGNQPKVRDVRLPTWLIPVSYEVEMKPDIYQNDPKDFTNTGNVSILMDCKEETTRITLHIKSLTVKTYSLKEEGGADIAIDHPVYDNDREFVNFTTSTPLEVNKQYRLTLSYSGPLKNDLAGLYYSTYKNGSQDRYIATTQYQPTDARKAFPCFDEPALKANFTISLWRHPSYVALSNMPIVSNETSGEWAIDHFKETVKMSTYLLAMIVCDFGYKENTTENNITFRVWARKEAINQVDYALDQGIRILTYFEEFFNESFPLPKTDMIAIPDFAAGAMENWGLITYRETALLYDEKVSAASNKQRVAVVVSHELAHQWFGNLVSPTWWDDLWLNEGFATYVEYIGVDFTEPTWQMLDQFVITDVQSTLKADSLATSHPIYVEVQHPDEINEIFDSISYGKGGSLIRMMRYFLGDVTFTRALSNYIDNKQYRDAHHDHLWQAMQDEADRQQIKDDRGNALNVKEILDTWLLQMGYPLLEVQSNPPTADGKVTLTVTQSHFLQDDSQEPDPRYPSPYDYRWDVPVSYATSDHPDFDVTETSVHWFYKDDNSLKIEINASADWVVINPKQYGFYRVNYPEEYWQRLIDTQERNHTEINELNRAQIIDDAFNLALAGKLRITYAMALTKYLEKEESYFPWDSAIGSLSYVSAALERTPAYGDFKTYYKKLILPYYNKFNDSWIFDSNSSIISQYRQSSAISRACAYDVADCRDKAHELLQDWMDSGNNSIHPNARSVVYCHGVKAGGAAEWEFIFKEFQEANVAAEQIKLLQSLGCTNELWLLQRLLDYAVDDSKIRKQDSYIAVGAVAGNTIGGFLAWDWLRANWATLDEEFGSGIMMLGRFVSSATNNFFTQFDFEQVEAFVKMTGDLGTATRAFEQAKERTQNNIKYLERNQEALTDWLKANV